MYNIIVFSSITYALKGQGILEEQGIKTKLEKLKKEQYLNGCGYGLKIRNNDLIYAKNTLANKGIMIIAIYEYK